MNYNYKNIPLDIDCEYEAYCAGSSVEPPTEESLQVYKVVLQDYDITELLKEEVIEEIEKELLRERKRLY